MTKEEKSLLLQDLCGRLPYCVKAAVDFKGYLDVLPSDNDLEYTYRKNLYFILDYEHKTIEDISKEPNIIYSYPCSERFQMLRGYTYQEDYGVPIEFIKPYLRPMSSMTEEEYENFRKTFKWSERFDNPIFEWTYESYDWLNAHHFDHRGLIEKGLALEAPEGMYKN